MDVADGMEIVATSNLGHEVVVHINKVWANGAAFTIKEAGYSGTYSAETGYKRGRDRLYSPTMRNLAPDETAADVTERREKRQAAADERNVVKAKAAAEMRRQAIERNAGSEPFKLMTADPKQDVTVLTAFSRSGSMYTVYYIETTEQGFDYNNGEHYPTNVARFVALDHGAQPQQNPWNKGEASVRQGENIAHEIFFKLW